MANSDYQRTTGGSISLDDVVDKMKGLVSNVDDVVNTKLDALKKGKSADGTTTAEAGKINPAHLG